MVTLRLSARAPEIYPDNRTHGSEGGATPIGNKSRLPVDKFRTPRLGAEGRSVDGPVPISPGFPLETCGNDGLRNQFRSDSIFDFGI